jgi:hypothetical protein
MQDNHTQKPDTERTGSDPRDQDLREASEEPGTVIYRLSLRIWRSSFGNTATCGLWIEVEWWQGEFDEQGGAPLRILPDVTSEGKVVTDDFWVSEAPNLPVLRFNAQV